MMFLRMGSRSRRSSGELDSVGRPLSWVPSKSFFSSKLQDIKASGCSKSGKAGSMDKCSYRSQLEEEVRKLQLQLQEEIDLNIALTDAVGCKSSHLLPCSEVPNKIRELLFSIAALEIAVSTLEDDLISLHARLSQKRNEHFFYNGHSIEPFEVSNTSIPCLSTRTWESKHIASRQNVQKPCYNSLLESGYLSSNKSKISQVSASCSSCSEEMEVDVAVQVGGVNISQWKGNLWLQPDKLSQEMIRSMKSIFLCLSKPSMVSSKIQTCHSSSPVGYVRCSSSTSTAGSSEVPGPAPSPELLHHCANKISECTFDPYGVHLHESQANIGIYSSAAEISWMTVGKKQLEYAAEALKRFRSLVAQLANVNPARMSCNEKLAFWMNLYNALVMHAYLAYGVPESEEKYFSLMQKASYIVGGHPLSAADIEYNVLKAKPIAHRSQMASMLTVLKSEVSNVPPDFGVDNVEPLVTFCLSCGMYSSPAVRIFTASNIQDELQSSMTDYIQASVSIDSEGKLLVPQLLHCFAKGVVEDSLLVDWICRFLSREQVSVVRNSPKKKHRLLGARSFGVLPFDSRFRYLFLSDSKSSRSSPQQN